MPFAKPYSPGLDTKPHLPGVSDDSAGAAKPYSPGLDSKPHLPGLSEDSAGHSSGSITPVPPDLDEQRAGSGLYIEAGDTGNGGHYVYGHGEGAGDIESSVIAGEIWLWTGSERDVIIAGDGKQNIFAGDGPDYVSGGNGDDVLFGEGGNDRLYGDHGRDFLVGGMGADRLSGGADPDTFFYRDPMHESPATSEGADTIVDFSRSERDEIDLPVSGTAENYGSASTNAASMDEAAQEANQNQGGNNLTYLYLANEKTDTGYLLADLDGNGNFETGITLIGSGGPGEFDYHSIV